MIGEREERISCAKIEILNNVSSFVRPTMFGLDYWSQTDNIFHGIPHVYSFIRFFTSLPCGISWTQLDSLELIKWKIRNCKNSILTETKEIKFLWNFLSLIWGWGISQEPRATEILFQWSDFVNSSLLDAKISISRLPAMNYNVFNKDSHLAWSQSVKAQDNIRMQTMI